MNIVNVNRSIMNVNRANKTEIPPLSVKSKGKVTYCKTVEILDGNGDVVGKLVFRPNKPLKCGATIWLEAKNIKTDMAVSFNEAKANCHV